MNTNVTHRLILSMQVLYLLNIFAHLPRCNSLFLFINMTLILAIMAYDISSFHLSIIIRGLSDDFS